MLGINDRVELARARKEMNARLCAQHMRDGVTIVDPETTYLEPELEIGIDTVIYPNTTISRLSRLGKGCVIGPNSRLSNAMLGERVTVRESVVIDSTIGSDVSVGPFAHLRGDTRVADRVHVGNFVEIKKSKLARGVKVSHLSYLGDATIGEETNVGAGTITCNYDGTKKNPTIVGRDVSIGSNTSLVAPVTVGDGALTGAGSVVTKDVRQRRTRRRQSRASAAEKMRLMLAVALRADARCRRLGSDAPQRARSARRCSYAQRAPERAGDGAGRSRTPGRRNSARPLDGLRISC